MKQQILSYLIDHYNKTKWPYVNLMEIKNQFGNNISNELNDLYQEGFITKEEGANTPLIKLIKFEI